METVVDETMFLILPGFAEFILNHRLDEFTDALITYARKSRSGAVQAVLRKPDLKDRFEASAVELLRLLHQNKPRAYISWSIEKWENDQLYGLKKTEIDPADVTAFTNIGQSALLDLALDYCDAKNEVVLLSKEINGFFVSLTGTLLETQGKFCREKLRSGEEQLLEVQAIAQVGSFKWNFEQPADEYSPQLERILGTKRAETFAEFLRHVHEEDRQRLEEEYRKALESGVFACEYRYRINNKTKVLCTRAVVEKQQGKPTMMRGTVQDISAWKAIEAELVQKSVALRESNSRLQHFAATASHDLKEPLRKISTYASWIEAKDKDHLSAESQEFLKKILRSADRMQALIENLLAYASLDNYGQEGYCDLQQILEDVLESLEFKIKEKGARVLSDGLPQAVVIPFQIHQLFQNLISNALKFCKKDEKPVVLISHSIFDPGAHSTEKKVLKIEFTDSCIGFSNSHSSKIFDAFYRAHGKTTAEGTGLGLAICRKIVENHNGTISVTSEENKGSTFTIILPLKTRP